MNSNLFHNISNIASLVLAAATAALIASGCTEVANALDCSNSWINPAYTSAAIAGLQFLKIAVNIVRDGLGGLVKQQPPVQ